MKKAFILFIILCCIQAGSFAQSSNVKNSSEDNHTSIIFLVRHAEPAPPPYSEKPPNPGLTENGKKRADLLAQLLSDTKINTIYSTNLNRTRETAEPLRAKLNLQLEYYDLKSMQTIANKMKNTPGIYLVSGHSNTTPDMVKLLGGESGTPINENEFDRLYIVTITDGKVSTVLLRYGAPYKAE